MWSSLVQQAEQVLATLARSDRANLNAVVRAENTAVGCRRSQSCTHEGPAVGFKSFGVDSHGC